MPRNKLPTLRLAIATGMAVVADGLDHHHND
jgi:hypothetical protein